MPTRFDEHSTTPLELIKADHLNTIQDSIQNMVQSRWVAAPEAWTYASTNSFTINGDYTDIYTVGTRLRMVNGSQKYFYVSDSTWASPSTTVTVVGGNQYSLVDDDIDYRGYSHFDLNQDWDGWLAFTPNYTGFSANPTTEAYFRMIGPLVEVFIRDTANGTSNNATHQFTLPVPSSQALINAGLSYMSIGQPTKCLDNGTSYWWGHGFLTLTTTIAEVRRNGGATWTASGASAWSGHSAWGVGHKFVYLAGGRY